MRKGSFKWGEFLSARCELIHYWHNEGKSDAEIAKIVSADAAQIHSIRRATNEIEGGN